MRESNPESRFSKFAENDEALFDISVKRATLLSIKREADKKIEELEGKCKEIKATLLALDSKQKDYSTVNKHIDNVNSIVEEPLLKKLDVNEYFNEEDFLKFNQSIISADSILDWNIRELSVLKSDLSAHQSKLTSYSEYYSELSKVKSSISLIKIAIDNRSNIERFSELHDNYKEELRISNERKAVLNSSINSISQYFIDRIKNDELNLENSNKKTQIKETEHKIEKSKARLGILESSIQRIRIKERELRDSLESGTAVFGEISDLSKFFTETNKIIKDYDKDLEIIRNNISKLLSRKEMINRLDVGSEILREYEDFFGGNILESLRVFQKTYIKLRSERSNQREKLDTVKSTLEVTKEYSKDLKALINKANDIIAKTQQSDCPVCRQSYESYTVLNERLISNPLFDSQEQQLLKNVSGYEITLKALDERIDQTRRKFKDLIDSVLFDIDEKHSILRNDESHLVSKRKGLYFELKRVEEKLYALKQKVQFKTVEEYREAQERLISQSCLELKKLLEEQAEVQDEIENNYVMLNQLVVDQSDLDYKIELQFGKLLKYTDINDFIRRKNLSEVDENRLQELYFQERDKIDDEIVENESRLQGVVGELQNLKGSLNDDYSRLSKSNLEERKETFLGKQDRLKETLSDFEGILPEVGFSNQSLQDKAAIEKLFEHRLSQLVADIERKEACKFSLEAINKLARDIVGSGGMAKLKADLASLREESKQAKSLSEEIQCDINILSSYINNKVDTFFKTELINQIYQTIDPHPEFKNIRFECITDEKPKLLIKAETDDGSISVSPVLSFSSAQVNVLALSIFLARALYLRDDNGIPVDCIFIDDPVQSIDSINTLSLIDLFRSIVVRFDKQIIVTTHDENFHELLKKKMPRDLFPAKYLKLESYGKVALDA